MKLFQQMLVASASLSLLTPFVAQASDVNIEEMNSYSRSTKSSNKRIDSKTFSNEIVKINERVDNIESKFNEFEAGGFSDTTVLSGKAIFDLGGVDTNDTVHVGDGGYGGEAQFMYTYTMNLNTSFTGDDNLYTRIKTGNHSSWSKTKSAYNTYLSSGNGNGDTLKVDKLWYSFPLGDNQTVTVGPKIENYYMHATTPSIYEPVLKAFTLGGNAAAYGASTSPGAGWAYNADNGFAISSNVTSKNPVLSNESASSWATQVGYTQPNYSVSALVNIKANGWTDSYFMTVDGKARPGDGNSTNVGLRGWWRPTDSSVAIPSISVGYDTSETDASSNDGTSAYFVGLNWVDVWNADDKIGVAFGQPQKVEGDSVDPFLYEVYYKYKVNDSITVTPTIFGGTSKNTANQESNMSGYLVQTTFKF